MLAVKPSSIRKWLKQGRLKGVKAGKLWRVREQDLEAFLARKTTPEDDMTEEDVKATAEEDIRQGRVTPFERRLGR